VFRASGPRRHRNREPARSHHSGYSWWLGNSAAIALAANAAVCRASRWPKNPLCTTFLARRRGASLAGRGLAGWGGGKTMASLTGRFPARCRSSSFRVRGSKGGWEASRPLGLTWRCSKEKKLNVDQSRNPPQAFERRAQVSFFSWAQPHDSGFVSSATGGRLSGSKG